MGFPKLGLGLEFGYLPSDSHSYVPGARPFERFLKRRAGLRVFRENSGEDHRRVRCRFGFAEDGGRVCGREQGEHQAKSNHDKATTLRQKLITGAYAGSRRVTLKPKPTQMGRRLLPQNPEPEGYSRS